MATDDDTQPTQEENDKRAKEIAALMLLWKLSLEERLKPKLTTFFRQIGNDAAAVWIATGNIIRLDTFDIELVTLLRNHYRAVAKKFDDEFKKRIVNPDLLAAINADTNIDHRILQYINHQSIKQSQYILKTTYDDLVDATKKAMIDLAVAGIEPTRENVAKRIKENFKDSTDSRINTIAITETQIPAERVKLIEGEEIANLIAVQTSPIRTKITKKWIAILDERTRHWHAEADGQNKPIDEPYVVNGQLLMHPGDESLGATANNIVNCRCNSINGVDGVF